MTLKLEAKTIPALVTKGASSSTAEMKLGRKRKMTDASSSTAESEKIATCPSH